LGGGSLGVLLSLGGLPQTDFDMAVTRPEK
jgi:hypothetical protein